MMRDWPSRYHKCFISAPYGLHLGALPGVLAERGIDWQWAKDDPNRIVGTLSAIRSSDFFIGVLTGTRSDYRVIYEAGVAGGLGKPVLLFMTRFRVFPFDQTQFSIAKVSLSNSKALAFQLDMFVKTPHQDIFTRDVERPTTVESVEPIQPESKAPEGFHGPDSELERRVYEVVLAGGGTALAQPKSTSESRFRPDLLVWLARQEPELLDPAVIEIKGNVDPQNVRQVEEQLLAFMQTAGVRSGIVITAEPLEPRQRPLSANVFWLHFEQFEKLVRTSRLGAYIRDARNRFAHGVQ